MKNKERLMRKVYYMLPSEIKQVKKTAKEYNTSESKIVRGLLPFLDTIQAQNYNK